jgi:hypothetical protein
MPLGPMSPAAPPRHLLPLLAIALLAIATRALLWTHVPYHWDAVQLALGALRYDPMHDCPHMPGYFLFCKTVALLLPEAPSRERVLFTVELLNLAFTLLAAAGTYILTLHLQRGTADDRLPATFAALLLLASPVFWIYSAGTESYTADAAFGAWIAVLLWRAGEGAPRWEALATGVTLGLWAGFRSTGALMALPAALVVYTWRRDFVAAALFLAGAAGTVLTWAPWWLSYYPSPSLQTVRQLSDDLFLPILREHSVLYGAPWQATAKQVALAAGWLLACLGEAGLVTLGLALLLRLRARDGAPAATRRELVGAALLLAPPCFVHGILFAGKPAYWFLVLPALMALVATVACRLASGYLSIRRLALAGAAVLLLAALRFNATLLLTGSSEPHGRALQLLDKYSAGAMLRRQADTAAFAARIGQLAVESEARGETLVVFFTHDSGHLRWRQLQWLAPQVLTILLDRPSEADPAAGRRWRAVLGDREFPLNEAGHPLGMIGPGPLRLLVWCNAADRVRLREIGFTPAGEPDAVTARIDSEETFAPVRDILSGQPPAAAR